MPQAQSKGNPAKWYPSQDQLKDPATTTRTLRVVLDRLYALQDSHVALQQSHAALQQKVAAGPAQTQGPVNTKLLGLNVEPVDTNSLANGAALKYNSARGTFSFQ